MKDKELLAIQSAVEDATKGGPQVVADRPDNRAFTATVRIEPRGPDPSIVLNDPNATSVSEALDSLGFEPGTIRRTHNAMVVSVWNKDD